MEQRRFGRSELASSVIGFGTWPIGGARYGRSDDAAAIRAIQAALDAGVTCFDTAPSYGDGHAERLLGRALGGRRSEALIVTKGGLVWDEGSHVLGRDSRDERLREILDGSLVRLGTDYVDLFLIHWPDPSLPLEAVARTLEGLVASGKTRAVGVSNFRASQLRELAALSAVPLAVNQVGFSLFDRRWAADGFAACRELGVGVMAYGALAHGLLTGTWTRETVLDGTDWRAAGSIFGQELLTPANLDRNLHVVDRLGEIAAGRGATLPQLALAWVLGRAPVAVALVGARSEREILEAVPAAGLRLAEAEEREIEEVMAEAAGRTTALPE